MAESPLKILVVDNHPLFLKSITGILSSPEFELRTAEGGLEAIDIIDSFTPSIFFIDMIMPYIDGDKLSRYIRSQKKFDDSFIIILSGIAKESENVNIPPSADAFIAKGPIKYMGRHMLELIDKYREKTTVRPVDQFLGLDDIVPRHITKELLFSLRHLEVLLGNMQEGVVEISTDNRIVYANPAAVRILGTDEMDLLSKDILGIFSGPAREKVAVMLEFFDSGDNVGSMIFPVTNHIVKARVLKVTEGIVEARILLLSDVTEFKEKELMLQKAVGEKEMLIREIHHRVKNNLNVISGLIGIQSSMIDDEAIRDQLLEIQPRLHSISLVHDKLYNSDDLANVSFGIYIRDLAELLIGMMTSDDFSIGLEVNVPDVTFNTDKILSLGLICTELITNAVKYGFYKDNPERNLLVITLQTGDINTLSIRNNGHLFPDHIDYENSEKLGFQVIELLVGQLGGEMELKKDSGTEFVISFS